VGMEPSIKGVSLPDEIVLDSSGFIETAGEVGKSGMFSAGCATNALDVNRAVQNATAASLRAIQVINKTAGTEAA
ncbi:MAG: heterodisulfide reductase subunit A, partial [Sulfuritalea sp.]|nr:heterodisulfide reductase subunit A [Sulfuritalea sp.]